MLVLTWQRALTEASFSSEKLKTVEFLGTRNVQSKSDMSQVALIPQMLEAKDCNPVGKVFELI